MHPWLLFWAPQIHFPLSGNLAQNIDPNTSWFSDLIRPPAGNAQIEQKAFQVASYGKQLGQIVDVLLEMAQSATITSPEAVDSLKSLKKIKASIQDIKDVEYASSSARLIAELTAMRKRGGTHYESLVPQLRSVLEDPAPKRVRRLTESKSQRE